MNALDAEAKEHLVQAVKQYYDERLKAQLEPARKGEFVAIDLAAGLHSVGADPIDLYDDLIARGSNGPRVLLRVGYDWTFDMLAR
jgi:hypothetical protein